MSGQSGRFERDELVRALEARERFLTGVIGSLESFVTVDEEWRLTFVNAAAAHLIGTDSDDPVGRDVRPLLLEKFSAKAVASLELAMSANGVSELEAPDRSGEHVYGATAYPLADGGLAIYVRDVTVQVRGAEALARSEERYRELVEGVNSAVVRWDADGVVTFVNKHAEELFGWTADELVGQLVMVLLPHAEAATSQLPSLDRQILDDPDSHVTSVNENVRKDGTRLWIAWTNRAVRGERGEVREILAIGNDVTDLVQAQAKLRESESRYEVIVETAGEGIVLAGVNGTYVFANRRMADMLGYPPEELLGKSTLDFTFDAWRPMALEVRSEIRQRKTMSGEFKFKRRDGSELWTHYRATAMFDSSGRHIGNLSMHTDITERKRTRGALRESEERYRRLFESMEEGFALCELVRDRNDAVVDFRYQDVNPALERLLRLRPDALRGRLHSEILPPDPESLRWYVAAVAKGFPDRRQQQSGPTGRWYDVTILPRSADRFALLFDDVTERRLAEDALRESQRRLEVATEAAALGIYDYDVRSGELSVDRRVRDLWGLEPVEPVSYGTLVAGVHPDDRAEVQAAVDAALGPGREAKFSLSHRVVRRKDGSVRWIQLTGQALFEGREGVRLVGTVEDITDRVHAQLALRKRDIEKAGQEERSRLARDLHDSVTQALFASSLRAEALASTSRGEVPKVKASLAEVHRLNRGALAQMRSMLLELRGDPVTDVPLQQLLRNAVEATESRCSAAITLSMSDGQELPPIVHEAVYRITQEALNNIARHARASNVLVRLEVDGSQPSLTIRDDGGGFDVTAVDSGHFGLASMRERARESGGDLRVESRSGQGTTVTATWRPPAVR